MNNGGSITSDNVVVMSGVHYHSLTGYTTAYLCRRGG